jgi:hypothetical protein
MIKMEHTALNMSEFQNELKEQYKLETSRTVKIFMLTYRCISALLMVGLMQVIFLIVEYFIRDSK